MNIKTVAELKRRLTPGTRVTLYFSRIPWRGDESLPLTREIAHANTVGIGFITPRGTSYLDWPKADRFLSTGPNDFTILDEQGAPHLAYRIEVGA